MDTTAAYQMAGIEIVMTNWLDSPEKSLPSSEIAVSICLQLSRSAKIFQTTFQEIYKKDLSLLKGEETFYDEVMRGKDYQDLSMRHPRLMDPRVSKAQKIAFLLAVLNGADCESRPLEQICTLVSSLPKASTWKAMAPAKRYLPYVEFRKKEMENFRQWGVWYYKKTGWSDVESKIRFGESCFTYAGFRPDHPYELADGCRIPCPIISDSKVLNHSSKGKFEISELPGRYINEMVMEVTSIGCGIRSLGQLYLAFPILQILDLAGNQLQHIDSKYLPKSLTELTLSYNKIEAPVLENLPQLQRIILDGNPLRDCTGIRNLPELRLLSIKMCGLSFDSYQMIDPSIRTVTVNSDKAFGFEPPLEDRELFAKVLPYCFDRWLAHGEEIDYLGLREISHGILSTIDQWFKEQWERLHPQLDDSVARSRLIRHFDSYNKRNGESIEELIEYFAVRYFPDSSDRLQSNSTLRNQTKDQKNHMLKHAFPMFQLLLPLSSSEELTQPELSHLNHLLWNLKDRRGLREMKEDYDKRIVIKNTSRLPSYIVQKFPTLKMLSLSLCEMRSRDSLVNLLELQHLTQLTLSSHKRFSFPNSFSQMENLIYLKMTSAEFTALPQSLKYIVCDGNWEEPIVIDGVPKLEFLILEGSQYRSLKVEAVPALESFKVTKTVVQIEELVIHAGGKLNKFEFYNITGKHFKCEVEGASLTCFNLGWEGSLGNRWVYHVVHLSKWLKLCKITLEFIQNDNHVQLIDCNIYPLDKSGHRTVRTNIYNKCDELIQVSDFYNSSIYHNLYTQKADMKNFEIKHEARISFTDAFSQTMSFGTMYKNS